MCALPLKILNFSLEDPERPRFLCQRPDRKCWCLFPQAKKVKSHPPPSLCDQLYILGLSQGSSVALVLRERPRRAAVPGSARGTAALGACSSHRLQAQLPRPLCLACLAHAAGLSSSSLPFPSPTSISLGLGLLSPSQLCCSLLAASCLKACGCPPPSHVAPHDTSVEGLLPAPSPDCPASASCLLLKPQALQTSHPEAGPSRDLQLCSFHQAPSDRG